MKKSKLGLLFLSSLALVTGVASTGVAGIFANYSRNSVSVVKAEGSVPATMTAGTNGSAAKVNDKDAIKVGTSKAGGDMKIKVPTGSTSLTFYAAAWTGVSDLSLNITPAANVNPSNIELKADTGMTGNGPFTSTNDEKTYKFTLDLNGIESETTFTLAPSIAKRFVVWDASCVVEQSGEPTVEKYTVNFETSGGSYIPAQVVESGDQATKPADPSKDGYVFEGWYTAADGGDAFDFTSAIDSNTDVFAHWGKVDASSISDLVNGNKYRVIGKVIGKKAGNSWYIADTTGTVQLYGTTFRTSISVGDVIDAYGTYDSSYNEIKDILYYGKVDSTVDVAPITSLDSITVSSVNSYVSLKNIKLGADMVSASNKDTNIAIDGEDDVTLYYKTSSVIDNYSSVAESLKSGTYVDVEGMVSVYNNKPQILVSKVSLSSVHTVVFNAMGGSFESFSGSSIVADGEKVSKPEDPSKDSDENGRYTFENWYVDSSYSEVFDFNTEITSNIIVYAKYTVKAIPVSEKFESSITSAGLSYKYSKTEEEVDGSVEDFENLTTNLAAFADSGDGKLAAGENFTALVTKGSSTESGLLGTASSYFKFYSGNNLDISINSSLIKIKEISLYCTNGGYAKKAKAFYGGDFSKELNATVDTTTASINVTMPSDSNEKTVRITNTDSGQARINRIKVTFEKNENVTSTSFAYSNVALRFGGLVSADIWNGLGTVSRYGVMLAKSDSLSGNLIKNIYSDSTKNSALVDVHTDVTDSSIKPSVADVAQLPEEKKDGNTYYVFNAYIPVNNVNNFKAGVSAVAYVVVNGTYHFMKQRDTSVVDIAKEYVDGYGESAKTIYDGSLYDLASK